MFKINGVYRAQHETVDINRENLFLHTYREYISPSGEKCSDVIFDEYGYSQDFKGDGYYKIVGILSEDAVYDKLGAIDHYDAKLRLEKIADWDWLNEYTAESFFSQLEDLGFYVAHKSIPKYSDEEQEEWIGIDTERGILAHCETVPTYLRVEFTFLYPEIEFVRELLDYEDLNRGVVSSSIDRKSLRDAPYSLPDSMKLTSFAPNIFDLIRRKNTCKEHWKKRAAEFCMPFVNAFDYEYPHLDFGVIHTEFDNQWPYSQGEYKAYFARCRKIFREFPVEVQSFLHEYTEVSARYLGGKPRLRFRNQQSEPVKNTDYLTCIKIVGIGAEGMEISRKLKTSLPEFSDLCVQYINLNAGRQKYLEDNAEDINQRPSHPFAHAYAGDNVLRKVLASLQGADLVIVLLPSPSSRGAGAAPFVANCANRIGAFSLCIACPDYQDMEAGETTRKGEQACRKLWERTRAYISLEAKEAPWNKEKLMAQTVKSILSLCSEGGQHSPLHESTPFAELKDMLYVMFAEKSDVFNVAVGEADGDGAAVKAAELAMEDYRKQESSTESDRVLLQIETAANTLEPLPQDIRQAIAKVKSSFGEDVRLLYTVSTDVSQGQGIRVTLIAKAAAGESFQDTEDERFQSEDPVASVKRWSELQQQKEQMIESDDWE